MGCYRAGHTEHNVNDQKLALVQAQPGRELSQKQAYGDNYGQVEDDAEKERHGSGKLRPPYHLGVYDPVAIYGNKDKGK